MRFYDERMDAGCLSGKDKQFCDVQADIDGGRIRHLNDRAFMAEPLQVFRTAQIAARLDLNVAEETIEISSRVDGSSLSGKQIMAELEKVLIGSSNPSTFFRVLRRMNQLSVWFPEVEHLIGVPQNTTYHPEGDVWEHTMQVLDEAAKMRNRVSEPLCYMLSALCHDFGKAVTTDKNGLAFHAYGHETKGLPLVHGFLSRLTNSVKRINYVLNMTKLHMEPNQKARSDAHIKSYMKLFDRSINPSDLICLAKADYLGRIGMETDRHTLELNYERIECQLHKMLELYQERIAQPHVMGRDLIMAGVQPGPIFRQALAHAHKLRLAGATKEQQLRHTLGWLRRGSDG